MGIKYSKEIDGIRGLSIVAILLFHCGIKGFSGGFTGVDVYFVISGYLITGIILKEIESGEFSFLKFIERRIRRIAPALIVMISCVIVTSLIMLLPSDLDDSGFLLKGTSLFLTNAYDSMYDGYFSSSNQPLLHLWSISLEVQFYIAYAIFTIICIKFSSKYFMYSIFILSIVSFIACQAIIDIRPHWDYYLLPFRGWEFGLGAIVSRAASPDPARKIYCNVVSVFGILLIAIPFLLYDSTFEFPGVSAVPSCVGASLLIYAKDSSSYVMRVLRCVILVFIGRISYSIYIWHWPIIIFFFYQLEHAPSAIQTALLIIFILGVSTCSWLFIEQPFRTRRLIPDRIGLLLGVGASFALFGGLGIAISRAHGWPARLPSDAQAYREAEMAHIPTGCPDTDPDIRRRSATGDYCVIGDQRARPTWALWGDSQARALSGAFAQALNQRGESAILFGLHSCPALLDVNVTFYQNGLCSQHNNNSYKRIINSPEIKNVVLMSRYSMYLNGTSWGGKAGQSATTLLTDADGSRARKAGREKIFEKSLYKLVDGLTKSGKNVYLYYPYPEATVPVPRVLMLESWKGAGSQNFTIPLSYYKSLNQTVLQTMNHLIPEAPGKIIRIYPTKAFCNNKNCMTQFHGNLLYRDSNHPTSFAAKILIRPLEKNMRNQRQAP